MGFFNKLMFWKKDDLGDFGRDDLSFKDNLGQNMDFGAPQDNLGLPSSQGMPDLSTFKGVGDFNQQQAMNRSIQQQFPDGNYNSRPFTSFSPGQSYQEASPVQSGEEIRVISAKLDAIRANLDAINQRLANIERIAYGEQEQRRDRW